MAGDVKQGGDETAVPTTTGVTLMGDPIVDKGTGLYPMAKPEERTQETDNSSTGAVAGYTEPKTVEADVDNSSSGAIIGATDPTHHFQWPAAQQSEPKTEEATPEPKSEPAPVKAKATRKRGN